MSRTSDAEESRKVALSRVGQATLRTQDLIARLEDHAEIDIAALRYVARKLREARWCLQNLRGEIAELEPAPEPAPGDPVIDFAARRAGKVLT